jgi:hypothetical protein
MSDEKEIKSSIELPRSLWDAAKRRAIDDHTTVKEIVRRALTREVSPDKLLPPESQKEDR